MLEIKRQFSDKFEFEILTGGMWVPPNTRSGGNELSNFMKQHAPPMIQTTGAIVSDKFYDLANNSNYTFSSLEASAAQVLVKQIKPEVTFEFASAVQKRFYQEGLQLNKLNTYIPILNDLGVDSSIFEEQWLSEGNLDLTQKEFKRASTMANGFPTLLIQMNGELGKITSGYFPLDAMKNHLTKLIA
jgi:putative protein-disulfide isomerase